MLKILFILLVSVLFCSSAVQAQVENQSQDVSDARSTSKAMEVEMLRLELSLGAQSLSNGYGDWKDLTIRSAYNVNQHVLQGEVAMSRRFNQDGLFVGVSDTYKFNEDWHGSIAVGAGDGAFYLPRYRMDGAIYRKLLNDRNLVASIGAGYYRAPDGHSDSISSLGLTYYFATPWILEGGVRFNNSQPGSVRTRQQFLAATYGRDKHDLIIARYGWGTEGYLAIADNSQLVNFKSSEASLTWRHWLNPATGMFVSVTRYTNPVYRRSGVNIGLFTSF